MSRRRFSERKVIQVLAWQGVSVCCYRCGNPFFFGDKETGFQMILIPEREHLHEYELGGADEPSNCRYSCSECHKIITNGTRATSAGSSKHRIAKAKRIKAGGRKRKGPKIPSRPMPKGRKFNVKT